MVKMKIVHASDLHIEDKQNVRGYIEKGLKAIKAEKADLILLTGDITDSGIYEEYRLAEKYLKGLKNWHAVPGNHDARNVGYERFEKFIHDRTFHEKIKGINLYGIDSSEPDLDDGHIGREKYEWLKERLDGGFSMIMMHHHIVPVPGAGRERHTIVDAGDFLKLVTDSNIDLVLCGHKHVCNLWKLNNTLIANTSTLSSERTRGMGRGYNVIEIEDEKVKSIKFKSLDSWSSDYTLL